MLTCPICLESVKIPVKFICFPCTEVIGKPRCNSIQRVCLHCAREYLQLNKPRYLRILERRCLTCDATCRPATLNASTAYEKDFLIMFLDTRSDYECKSCMDFKGTQSQLDNHNQKECPERFVFCTACLRPFTESDLDHKQKCKNFKRCIYCPEYLRMDAYHQHITDKHNKIKCRFCNQYHDRSDIHHEKQCPLRVVICPHCKDEIFLQYFEEHREGHISYFKECIKNMQMSLDKLEDQTFRPLELEDA